MYSSKYPPRFFLLSLVFSFCLFSHFLYLLSFSGLFSHINLRFSSLLDTLNHFSVSPFSLFSLLTCLCLLTSLPSLFFRLSGRAGHRAVLGAGGNSHGDACLHLTRPEARHGAAGVPGRRGARPGGPRQGHSGQRREHPDHRQAPGEARAPEY